MVSVTNHLEEVIGGYSTGELKLTNATLLYIYVGAQGDPDGRNGCILGGGGSVFYTAANSAGAAGGGSTDIRIR